MGNNVLRVFDSRASFQHQFRAGLKSLLRGDTVTVSQVVLVANNAIAIGDRFLFYEAMAKAQDLQRTDSADWVILDYMRTEPDPMNIIRRRVTDDGFVLVYSHLRGLRTNHLEVERKKKSEPPRAMPLLREFNPGGFNFNKVPEERFASVWCASGRVDLYYNKTPYYGWHVLCVPVPTNNYPQYLNIGMISLWQELYDMASTALPGCVMGYNSIGAWASINQLHFHLIYVEDTLVMPGRGDGGFGLILPDGVSAWPEVDRVQEADQPFNLVQDRTGLLLIRRLGQHRPGPEWSTGFAWFEVAGGFIVTCPVQFESITDRQIWTALQGLVALAA